jgi:hypothetical protein
MLKIQCLSLILIGMSILEHVNMSTYLVSLAPCISPSSINFQWRRKIGRFQVQKTGVFWAFWGVFGAFWGRFGGVLGRFGRFGAFFERFWAFYAGPKNATPFF